MKLDPGSCERRLTPCRCGNKTDFDLVSQQVCEDCCETFIVCGQCGFDPASEAGEHLESVMGGIYEAAASMAADVWNETMSRKTGKGETP